ncbi:MAG: zinc ribbon domain-containing protein [Dehalococcoidia bacterium]|nr:zinc ribbon domain-containing protein [Dehalococcoidia bacterium]
MSRDWARGEERLRPDDDCPLFSERLEEHIVGLTRGELPNAGRFCGHCYTPMAVDTRVCAHCGTSTDRLRPVEAIPDPVVQMLRRQRKTESSWVNGFAYVGLVVAAVAGLGVVLGIPYLRDNLLPATIVYGLLLVVGSRMLAGFFGGYWGDRIGYARGREALRASWTAWIEERERVPSV